MAIYDELKARIVALAEAEYAGAPDDYAALRASLGDVGSGPGWNIVTISDVDFLVGSAFNPKAVGGVAADGPDPVAQDKTVISTELKGIGDVIEAITETLANAVDQYEVVAFNSNSKVEEADANSGDVRLKCPIGVALEAGGTNDLVRVHTRAGRRVPIQMNTTPTANDNGLLVYLSTSLGKGTLTKPSTSGARIVILGVLVGADGSTDTPEVLWQPVLNHEDIP